MFRKFVQIDIIFWVSILPSCPRNPGDPTFPGVPCLPGSPCHPLGPTKPSKLKF